MFFQPGFPSVHVQSIDLILVDSTLGWAGPRGSVLPDAHGQPGPRRSTAARHPDLPRMVVALERPRSEGESVALPFVGWTLTLPPERWAGSRPLEV